MNHIFVKLRSKHLMTKAQIHILVPESPMGVSPGQYYAEKHRYKVLWLLHGASGDYDDWIQNDNICGHLRGHDSIVVMPYGLNSDYANHMEFANGYAFTDFFFEELMPFVYSSLPASDKPEDNIIAGFSMGGAGALLLGFLHPEKFGGIAALGASVRESDFLLPYLDMTGEEFRQFALSNRRSLPTEFGNPKEGITLKEINMIARYPTVRAYVDSEECTWNRFPEALAKGTLPPVLFCGGENDLCWPAVLRFQKYADELGADMIEYEIIPGYGHNASEPTLIRTIAYFNL